MKYRLFAACAALVFAAFCVPAFAQKDAGSSIKVGYVNTETILVSLPEAIDADKKLKDIAKLFTDTLKIMNDNLTAKFEAYKKQESLMTADAKRKEEESLKALQSQIMQYQEERFGQQGDYAKLREQALTPLRERIMKTIQEVAKEDKLTFVLDKANPGLLYAEDKYDLTFKVLDKIKRGGSK